MNHELELEVRELLETMRQRGPDHQTFSRSTGAYEDYVFLSSLEYLEEFFVLTDDEVEDLTEARKLFDRSTETKAQYLYQRIVALKRKVRMRDVQIKMLEACLYNVEPKGEKDETV